MLPVGVETDISGSILQELAAKRLAMEVIFACLTVVSLAFIQRIFQAQYKQIAWRLQTSSRFGIYCVLAAMILPVAVRLIVLPWVPPPEPRIHDEVSHLLVADTLAAGRLANPAHPMWHHLETLYVLQQPAYASIYPIGQGAILAVGQRLFGSPWAGVVISVSLMSGAIAWMLLGCLPRGWATAGALLAATSYGLSNEWMNSYWGGAFCASGGAVFFGALCRLWKSLSAKMAFIAGLGWSIVWLIRPFESFFLLVIAMIVAVILAVRLSKPTSQWLSILCIAMLAPVSAGLITAAHNRAVTGSYLILPYRLSQRDYGVPQSFRWQRPIAKPPLRFAEAAAIYAWQREVKQLSEERPLLQLTNILYRTRELFVHVWFFLPLAIVPFALNQKDIAIAGAIMVCALGAAMLYPFFFAHYIAAYACIIMFLIIRGIMILWGWSFRRRAVGHWLAVFVVAGGFAGGFRNVPVAPLFGRSLPSSQHTLRTQVIEQLSGLKGRHVVFVRYGPTHSAHREWVYNAASIDAAPIVWCRAMTPAEDAEVARYYKDRQKWIVEVETGRARVAAYDPEVWAATGRLNPESWKWVIEDPTERLIQGDLSSHPSF